MIDEINSEHHPEKPEYYFIHFYIHSDLEHKRANNLAIIINNVKFLSVI